MFCGNCGGPIDEGMTFCSYCGSNVNVAQAVNSNYTQQVNNPQPIKTTGLLVWSIIETLCIFPITGIIGLILYFTQLRPAAKRGDIEESCKAKKAMKIVLWVGLVLFILGIIITLAVAIIIPMTLMSNDIISQNAMSLDRIDSFNDSIVYQDDAYIIRNDYYDDYEF